MGYHRPARIILPLLYGNLPHYLYNRGVYVVTLS
jgi:hypothetical protein